MTRDDMPSAKGDEIDINQYQKLLKHWQDNGQPHDGRANSFGHYYPTSRSLNRMYRVLEREWADDKTVYWQYGWPTGRPPLKGDAAKNADKAALDDSPNVPRLLLRQSMKLENLHAKITVTLLLPPTVLLEDGLQLTHSIPCRFSLTAHNRSTELRASGLLRQTSRAPDTLPMEQPVLYLPSSLDVMLHRYFPDIVVAWA